MFNAINPATGKLIRSIPFDDEATIQTKLELADRVGRIWKKVPLSERTALILNLGESLLKNKEEYARLMVEEMGKPITAARGEIDKCVWVCRYYAEHAERFLAPRMAETNASKSYTSYEPIGALLAVMPWNFPFWQVFRFAVPNILAGNIILLKHSPNVPGCTVAIDDIFLKAGFPEDVLIPLYIDVDKIETVVASPIVKGLTLTGSTRAGSSIAALAGKYIKKSVLELGGSDPFIILEDADLPAAAKACAISRLKNAGQSCIGAKRIIILDSIYEEFVSHFMVEFAAVKYGDPMENDTTIGPLARFDLRDQLHEQVTASIAAGAECLLGGEIPDQMGAWYPVTVLAGVKPGMPAYHEELFGPVASLIRVSDEAEAIRIANDTPYGLGAAVFTRNIKRGEEIARYELDAGSCFVNEFVKSDPRLPFGGAKMSGYGRELSMDGMLEFVNAKTIWVS